MTRSIAFAIENICGQNRSAKRATPCVHEPRGREFLGFRIVHLGVGELQSSSVSMIAAANRHAG